MTKPNDSNAAFNHEQIGFLGTVAYAVAALVIILPFADIALAMLPLQLGNMRWRIGSIGLTTGAILLPMVGVFIALAAAHIQGHRRLQYVLATLTSLAAAFLLVLVVVFALDTLQLRHEIDVRRRHVYDRAALKGVIGQAVTVVVLAIMSIGSFRATRAGARRERLRKKDGDSLIVARVSET